MFLAVHGICVVCFNYLEQLPWCLQFCRNFIEATNDPTAFVDQHQALISCQIFNLEDSNTNFQQLFEVFV